MHSVLAANPLIQVTPGLMIWTFICFGVTFFVLKRFAFAPIQGMIDERRKRIREALDEADNARAEARQMLEEHRAMMAEARGKAEEILPTRGRWPRRRRSACARSSKSTASGGSRRRRGRSRPRRSARSSRSGPRSPS